MGAGLLALVALGCPAAPPVKPPVQAAEKARQERLPQDKRTLDAHWRDIEVRAEVAQGQATASATVDHLDLRFFKRPGPSQPLRLPVSRAELEKMFPLDVDQVIVRDGQVDYVDETVPAHPELWLHDVELSLENLTTRVRLTEGLPVLLTARATVQRSGDLVVFASADPFGKGINASGRASLRGLRLAELYEFLKAGAGLEAPQGTIDVYVEFQIRQGHITGGVKPILRNAEVKPVHNDVLDRIKAFFVDIGMDLLSDRVPHRNAVATVIPLSGTLNDPQAQVWPAVVSVLRNAFVQGISAGFAGIPPPPREGSR